MSKGFASNRLTLLAMGVIACFMGVCVRLVFLQVVDRDSLLQFVDKARRQIVVEHARRGTILDTHGDLLATSRSELTLARRKMKFAATKSAFSRKTSGLNARRCWVCRPPSWKSFSNPRCAQRPSIRIQKTARLTAW